MSASFAMARLHSSRAALGVMPLQDTLGELPERLALGPDHVVDVGSGVS